MSQTNPNILVLFTDDQRYDTIAALGNPQISTPNLDALVARGVAFTQAHIPSGMVGAVCMPSRAMLHTGRSLYHLDGAGESIPERFTLLGEHLRANGYETFGTGKWHNGREAYARSFSSGAEIMFGGMADHWNVPMCDFDPSGRYDHARPMIHDPYGSNHVTTHLVDHIHPGSHSTDLIAGSTISFLDQADAGVPFFACVSFLAPHDPRSMPKRFRDLYDPATIDLPESFLPEHPFDYGVREIRDELLEVYPRTEDAIRRHIAEYYAMISHLDDAVGRILAKLEARGVLKNTIIAFAGDNGLALGRHGLMGKQSLYDHSVRVPLILAGPGVPEGRTSDAFAYLFDLYPTLCDLAGLETPISVEGTSLVPALADSGWSPREELYFGYGDLVRAVKRRAGGGTRKLVCYANDSCARVQLFDLDADPGERVNVAGLPDRAEEQADLSRALERLCGEWGDRATTWGERFWSSFDAAGGIAGADVVRSSSCSG